jgi:cell division protein FtsQ
MFLLVVFLTAFSLIKNGERKIDLNKINYLDSNFNFTSPKAVNKLLKQSDSISLMLLKRDINLNKIENLLNENPFIDMAEVSLSLEGGVEIKVIEKEPVFRVLEGEYYIDSNGNKMPLSDIFSKSMPLIISEVDSNYFADLGSFGSYIKNDSFLSNHISGLEIINNEFNIYVRNYSYVIKMKDLSGFKNSFMNYKAFFKSVDQDSVLSRLSSINLNYRNQVIVQK